MVLSITPVKSGSRQVDGKSHPFKVLLGVPMKCGWVCGAQFTGRNMRAHSTMCPNLPAASGDVERRGREFEG
jgi:hypothetical protein